jgi:hypothetical protein
MPAAAGKRLMSMGSIPSSLATMVDPEILDYYQRN